MKRKGKRILLAFANLLAYLGTIGVNALANALPINGKTTGALSDAYPNLFVPSGLTFSIWGLIYLLLGIFAVYQLISAFRRSEELSSFIDRISIFFIISCAANIGWVFAWHYEFVGISLIFMVILLFSLLAVYQRLEIRKRGLSWQERIGWGIPFSVYLGWITVATIANVTALLVDIGWNGFGLSPAFWTILVIIVATIITLLIAFTRQDVFFPLVIEWAFLGIILKRVRIDAAAYTDIIVTLGICMGIILAAIAAQTVRRQIY